MQLSLTCGFQKTVLPVLSHDANLYRVSGVDCDVREMTLKQIKQIDIGSRRYGAEFSGARVPTLHELLKLVKSKCPNLLLGVEIKQYTEKTVDLTIGMLKEYGMFEKCWFYAFNARIIKYIKQCYHGRTMGYPDFQMQEFEPDSYLYYDELGLSLSLVRSELFEFYQKKGFPLHMFCADTEEDVRMCVEKGAFLITANHPVAALKVKNEESTGNIIRTF